MGYKIESYSFEEIRKKISSRDVLPSLFWAIPCGQWNNYELEDLFFKFNNEYNNYSFLGNYFIKSSGLLEEEKNKKKRYSVLSKGDEISIVLARVKNIKHKSLLILSSNFPKQGWGLIIKIDKISEFLDGLDYILSGDNFQEVNKLSRELNPLIKELKYLKESGAVKNKLTLEEDRDESLNNRVEWEKKFDKVNKSQLPLKIKFFEKIVNVLPAFFIDLEKQFRNSTEIVFWDEMNMISWKAVTGIKQQKTVGDFLFFLKEILLVEVDNSSIDNDIYLDGDIFYDYFHYLLTVKTFKFNDKRDIAKKILQYFRLDERKQILLSLGQPIEMANDQNIFLNLLGWQEPELKNYDTSIMSFFIKENDAYILNNASRETWSSLRESMESYLKDLIKILSSEITNDNSELYLIIRNADGEFRFNFEPNWNKEIEKITIGPAARIIKALGNTWNSTLNWVDLYSTISKIGKLLNENRNHHSDIIRRDDLIAIEITPYFNQLFKLVKLNFKTMPWHFIPNSSIWSFPSVYSGIAWSHDEIEKREIKIVHSDTNQIEFNKMILIWNPSKINPVMVNYKLL
jgi:hypothetical protein